MFNVYIRIEHYGNNY